MGPDGGYAGGRNSGDWGAGNSGWSNAAPSRDTSASDAAIAKIMLSVLGIVLGVVFILFIPVLVVMGLFYSLFRYGRFRPSLIAAASAVSAVIALVVIACTGGVDGVLAALHAIDFSAGAAAKPQVMAFAAALYSFMSKVAFVVGPWLGLLLSIVQLRKMQQSPWLVVNEGLSPKWMYHFRFRLSPFEAWRAKREEKEIREDKLRPYGRRDLVPMGIEDEPLNEEKDPAKVRLKRVVCRAEDEVPKHTMVTGAAGSGKTATLKSMMTRDIDNHKTIVVIDCKKDPEVAEFLSRRAHQAGCDFYHFSADLPYRIQGNPAGPSSYDPLASGSVSKKVDMMLGTREWDTAAAVYRDQAQAYLSKVFATIEAARKFGVLEQVPQLDTKQGEMWTFTQMLDRNVFNAVIVALNKVPEAGYIRQQASELNAQLSPAAGRTPEGKATQHAQAEYLSKMSGLMVQNYGRWLKGGEGSGSGKIIDIAKLTAEPGNVVLFSLDAAQQGDQGSLIGSMVCTDLANMTETRKNMGQDNPVAVYIDEFQSLPPECVKSMLQKARSAGVGLTLAFQSLDQVSATTGNDLYVKSLLDTCSNFIFHAGSNTATGEMASMIIGKQWVEHYMISRRNETKLGAFNWTNNRDLQVGTQRTQEWKLDPSSLQQLSMPNKQNGHTSEAIIIKKASSDPIDKGIVGAVSHKVRMVPPDCVLAEYFDPKSPPIDIDAPLEVRMSKGMAASVGLAREAEAKGVTMNELTGASAAAGVAATPAQDWRESYEPTPQQPIVSSEDVAAYKSQQAAAWDEYHEVVAARKRGGRPAGRPERPSPVPAPSLPMPSLTGFEETSADDFLSANQQPRRPVQNSVRQAPAAQRPQAGRPRRPASPAPSGSIAAQAGPETPRIPQQGRPVAPASSEKDGGQHATAPRADHRKRNVGLQFDDVDSAPGE